MRRRFLSFLLAGAMVFTQIVPANLQVYASQTPESTESVESEETVVISNDSTTSVENDCESVDETEESENLESVDEESADSEEITIGTEQEDESVITDDSTSEDEDSAATEEATTAAEDSTEQLDTFDVLGGNSYEMISLDSKQMIQTNGSYYYYAFTPSEDGDYTFYIDGEVSFGAIAQVDVDATESTGYYSYPGSAMTLKDCTAESTYYVKAYAFSESSSKVYVAVKEDDYDSSSVSVADITPSTYTVAFGGSYSITVNFKSTQNDFKIRSASAMVTTYYSMGDHSSDSKKNSDGSYTFTWNKLSHAVSIDTFSISVYDSYGYKYILTPTLDTPIVVSDLQSKLDEIAENGGGTLNLDSTDINEDITIPENVTLHVNDSCQLGNTKQDFTLTVNGTLEVRHLDTWVENITFGESGRLVVYEDIDILGDDAKEAIYSAAGITSQESYITGSYKAKIRVNYADQYEYRNGSWKTCKNETEIPDDEEVVTLDEASFQQSAQGTCVYRNGFWYKYTSTSDTDTLLDFSASVEVTFNDNLDYNNSSNILVYEINSEGTLDSVSSIYLGYRDKQYDSSNNLTIDAGKTYYFYFDIYGENPTISFSGNSSVPTKTAKQLADALDFANANFTSDISGDNTSLTLTIPVNEGSEELFNSLNGANVNLAVKDGDITPICMSYSEFSDNNLIFKWESSTVFSFDPDITSLSLKLYNLSFSYYDEESGYKSYHIYSGEGTNEVYVYYVSDFGKLDTMSIGLPYKEATQLELPEVDGTSDNLQELSTDYQVYSFTAQVDGEYTFYLTGNAEGQNYKSSKDSLSIYPDYFSPSYASSITMTEGQTVHLLAKTYESGSIGVIADTGDVAIESMPSSSTIVEGAIESVGSITMKDCQAQSVSLGYKSTDGYWSYLYFSPNDGESYSDTLNYSSNSYYGTGKYILASIYITDKYGKGHSFTDGDELGIDFSDYELTVQSFADYVDSHSGDTIEMSELNASWNKSLVIPEGKNIIVDKLTVNGTLTVNGSLTANEINVGYSGSINVSENGSVTAQTKVYLENTNNYQEFLDMIKGQSITTDDGTTNTILTVGYDYVTTYTWNETGWKKQRDDGYPDNLSDIPTMTKDDNGYSLTMDATSENAEYCLIPVEESGVYKISSTCENENADYWINTYKVTTDESGELVYSNLGEGSSTFYLSSEDQIVIRINSWSSASVNLSVVKAGEDILTADTVYEGLDFDKATLTKEESADASSYELTATIPVKAGSYLATNLESGSIRLNNLYFTNENSLYDCKYDKEKGVIIYTGTVMKSSSSKETVDYSVNRLSFYIESEYQEINIYLNSEDADLGSSHSVYTGYYNPDKLLSVSLELDGPKELELGKKYSLVNNSTGYYTFTPEQSGTYVLSTNGYGDGATLVDENGNSQWDSSFECTAGVSYTLNNYTIWSEDSDDPLYFMMEYDPMTVSVSEVSLDEPTGSHVSGKVSLNVTGGTVKNVWVYDDYSEQGINAIQEDDGTWSFEIFTDDNSDCSISSIYVCDEYGKNWSFNTYRNDYTSPTVKVGTLEEYLNSLPSGATVNIDKYLSLYGNLTIPTGITVNMNDDVYAYDGSTITVSEGATLNLYHISLKKGATLTVDGSLNVNYAYIYEGSTIESKGKISFGSEDDDTFIRYYGDEPEDPWDNFAEYLNLFTWSKGLYVKLYYNKVTYVEDDEHWDDYESYYIRVWDGSAWVTEDEYNTTPTDPSTLADTNLTATVSQAEEKDGTYAVTYGTSPVISVSADDDTGYALGKLSYSSSDTSVASVDANGKISLKKAGTADITVTMAASSQRKEATLTISLTVAKAEQKLTIGQMDEKYYIGDTYKMSVEASGSPEMSYESSDENVVTVDEAGTLHFVGAGEAKITITSKETAAYFEATKTVSVTCIYTKSVITCTDKKWNVGSGSDFGDNTIDLSERVTVTEGAENTVLVYESADESIATVNEAGVLTGVKAGTTSITIYAKANEQYSQSDAITVPVNVKEGQASFDEKSYISVSSALSDLYKTATTGTITLIDNTTKSEILHNPADSAVIKKDTIVTLNLAGYSYNGRMKVLGTLILQNRKSSSVLDTLSDILSVFSDEEESEPQGTIQLDGGKLVFEDGASTDDLQSIEGATAKIEDNSSESSKITYYSDLIDAIEDANDAATDENKVTVTLTDNAVLSADSATSDTEVTNITLESNVTLNLAGNTLMSDGTATLAVEDVNSLVSTDADNQNTSVVIDEKVFTEETLSAINSSEVVKEVITTVASVPSFEAEATEETAHVYDGNMPSITCKDYNEELYAGYTFAAINSNDVGVGEHTYYLGMYKDGKLIRQEPVTVTIEPATITVTADQITVADKAYDGSKSLDTSKVTFTAFEKLAALLSKDNVSITATSGSYASADVGTNDVTINIGLDGDEDKVANYCLEQTEVTTTAKITKASMGDITVDDQNVEYTGKAYVISKDSVGLTLPEASEIAFRLNASDNYTASLSIAEPGTYKVSYKITKPNYDDVTGSFQIDFTCKHTETKTVGEKAATCKEDGYTGNVCCAYCGELISSGKMISHETVDHQWDEGKVTTAASCKAAGVKTYTCKVCGTTKTESIAKLTTHQWDTGKVTKAATCKATGVMTYTCKVCGTTKTQAIPVNANAHSWVTTTQPATALKAGYTLKRCSICGKSVKTTIKKLTATIKLSATKKTIKKKKTYVLVVSKLAKGDSVKSVSTSKKAVATVKKASAVKYVITAKKAGKTNITVTLKSGKKATCTITVK